MSIHQIVMNTSYPIYEADRTKPEGRLTLLVVAHGPRNIQMCDQGFTIDKWLYKSVKQVSKIFEKYFIYYVQYNYVKEIIQRDFGRASVHFVVLTCMQKRRRHLKPRLHPVVRVLCCKYC